MITHKSGVDRISVMIYEIIYLIKLHMAYNARPSRKAYTIPMHFTKDESYH